MKEIIDGILFIIFGSMAFIMLHIAIKIYRCPSWKYNESRKKEFSGLAIDIRKNKWTQNEVIPETAVKEILS